MDDLSKECVILLTRLILLDKSVRPILFQDSWIFIGDFSAFSFLLLLDSAIRWTIIYDNSIIYLSLHLKHLINYPRIFIHAFKKFHQFTTAAAQNKTTSFCSFCSSLKKQLIFQWEEALIGKNNFFPRGFATLKYHQRTLVVALQQTAPFLCSLTPKIFRSI